MTKHQRTRKILDYHYGAHVTLTYIDDFTLANQYRVHVHWFDGTRHRRKQIAKYADFQSAMFFITDYLTGSNACGTMMA